MAQSRHALAKDVLLADQYRIDTVLGAGGFGITYLARDVGLGSIVVVKEYFPAQIAVRDQTATVHPHSDRESAIYEWGRERFVREARILDSCRHPNIVRVRRVLEANNTAYMALDFEDGPNLEAWLKKLARTPTQGEIDVLLWPLLDALAYLHALSPPVIHRDIAPDNIIIRGGNHPVLIDFGAAKVEIVGRAESHVGAVKDGYSPREQYSQRAELQGPWTDIYAMAATVRRAITGERPPDSMGRAIDDTMQPLAEMELEGFRPEFLAGIDAAMSVSHVDRPQSVDGWRQMLFDGVDTEVSAPRPRARSVPPRQSQPRSRSRPQPAAVEANVDETELVQRPVPAALRAAPPPAPARSSNLTRQLLLAVAAIAIVGLGGMAMANYLRKSQVALVTTPPPPSPPPASQGAAPSANAPAQAPQPKTSEPPAKTTSPASPAQTVDTAAEGKRLARECERIAHPPARGVAGVPFDELDGAAATAACDAAARALPDNSRIETLLGRALAKTANYGAARQWLERGAARGEAYAMFHLGVLFAEGQGVRRDYAKAREWYEKAIAKDEPHAMNTLGVLIENGRGTPADPAKAREWYEKAIAAGNIAATYNLGQLYMNGRGVPPDPARAIPLFEQAALRYHSGALHALGLAHETGRGVAQDYGKAREFYEHGAARNNSASMNNLGLFYENGRGVAQDFAKAREWYEKAAERGNGRSMLHLGIFYANGRGVAQDYAAARNWYERSVERGESAAMHNLSIFLDQGRGGDKDHVRAAALLLQAARAGSTNATATLTGTMARWAPDTVRAVQAALQASGHLKGQPTGTWDAASQAAAKLYAEARI